MYIQPFSMEVDWPEILCSMEVSTVFYICRYCVFTLWAGTTLLLRWLIIFVTPILICFPIAVKIEVLVPVVLAIFLFLAVLGLVICYVKHSEITKPMPEPYFIDLVLSPNVSMHLRCQSQKLSYLFRPRKKCLFVHDRPTLTLKIRKKVLTVQKNTDPYFSDFQKFLYFVLLFKNFHILNLNKIKIDISTALRHLNCFETFWNHKIL